ncbi:MAG: type II toxin-antitoxin system HicB family antitoxin [Patescibacteria group bacterium]
MKKVVQIYRLPVLIEHDADGYFATCPSLQGCYSQGMTYEEALANITSVMQLHIADHLADNEEIAQPLSLSLSTVEVMA